jgi:hypothetical protein
MSWFSRSLLDQIESGALSSKTDLADLLRKCIALGGQAESGELRDWARRELDGYRGVGDELPDYRRVTAPLLVDGIQGTWQFKRKQISTLELPDFATDAFTAGMAITFGAAELQRLASKTEPVHLQPAGMDDLVYFMNHSSEYAASIERIYFSVAPVAILGILDTIRTNLVALVAEIRSAGVGPNGIPSPTVADQAYNVVIKGRARANIAIGEGATATMNLNETEPKQSRQPTWVSIPWAVTIGLTTVLGGVAGVAAWVGWNPFT